MGRVAASATRSGRGQGPRCPTQRATLSGRPTSGARVDRLGLRPIDRLMQLTAAPAENHCAPPPQQNNHPNDCGHDQHQDQQFNRSYPPHGVTVSIAHTVADLTASAKRHLARRGIASVFRRVQRAGKTMTVPHSAHLRAGALWLKNPVVKGTPVRSPASPLLRLNFTPGDRPTMTPEVRSA